MLVYVYAYAIGYSYYRRGELEAYFLTQRIFSYPLISFMSVPIYVCSGEEVPIAKACLLYTSDAADD